MGIILQSYFCIWFLPIVVKFCVNYFHEIKLQAIIKYKSIVDDIHFYVNEKTILKFLCFG